MDDRNMKFTSAVIRCMRTMEKTAQDSLEKINDTVSAEMFKLYDMAERIHIDSIDPSGTDGIGAEDDIEKRLALADDLERRIEKLAPGGTRIGVGLTMAKEIIAALRKG